MPSPFPGMDPYLERKSLYREFHTQFLAAAQRLLKPRLQPKYAIKLEHHLAEGSVWEPDAGMISLKGKEPDLTVRAVSLDQPEGESTAVLPTPTVSAFEELDDDELALSKQRRIVIYVETQPRQAVASIELLSPSNKAAGTAGQAAYLAKRSSALHGRLHWIEIDLLRDGERPQLAVKLPRAAEYLAYVAQATPKGRNHHVYAWGLRDPLPPLPIPLLGADQFLFDLAAYFQIAYDAVGYEDDLNYAAPPPPPPLSPDDQTWIDALLKQHGLRP